MMSVSRRILVLLIAAGCSLFLYACGGSSPGASGASVSGIVYAPNGIDPMPGAQVRVVPAGASGAPAPFAILNTAPVSAETTTGPDGSFSITGLKPGSYSLVVTQGQFGKSSILTVGENTLTEIPPGQTTLPGTSAGETDVAPRVAVVTGEWDEMANVLAKFGMGQVDAQGTLLLGTEKFDLYLGNSSRPVWNEEWQDFSWDPYPEGYPTDNVLYANLASLRRYDVIVINCGANQEWLSAPGEPGVKSNLREYVRLGGRLYVTDRGNNFVEQAFPEFIRFQEGGDTVPSVPEPLDAAWVGLGGITTDAAVRDASLAAWLGGLGALNDNGALHVEDFLGGWAVIGAPEPTTEGGKVKVWVEGQVTIQVLDPQGSGSYVEVDAGIRPLTVSFPFGQGTVIYTSYHTAGMPHLGFTPQERVLEYLLLL
ncbi:MAG TPA: carboxypeptidase-like regulatory domain-containing protein [Candidatus Deferrimicrobiaceae bacterium]